MARLHIEDPAIAELKSKSPIQAVCAVRDVTRINCCLGAIDQKLIPPASYAAARTSVVTVVSAGRFGGC